MPEKPRTARAIGSAPSAYHHGDLRNALLREGRLLLEESGPGELSLRAVARRVAVSEAAPSRHFDGKEGLLAGIASQGFMELAAQREQICARQLGRRETVRQMMLSYVRYAQANKGVFNLMVGPRILDRDAHQELREAGSRSFNLFAEAVVALALDHGWPRGQTELVAHSAWAMEHGLATLILGDRAPRADRHVALEAMVSFSIDMLLSAILAGPAGLREAAKKRDA